MARLPSAIERDAVPDTPALREASVVHRVELRVNDQGQSSISAFALGEAPEVALVRASVDLNNPLRATVCGWSGRDYFGSATIEHPLLGADGDAMFGQGWLAAERAGDGSDIRWTSQAKAELALPLSRVGLMRVQLRLRPFTPPSSLPRTIAISVNGARLPSQPLVSEWRQYDWVVPEAALRPGLNRVTLEVAAEGK